MKVLALDPGIKNLGWTIIEKNDDAQSDEINLLNFGIINLNEVPKCDLCDKPSFYFSFDDLEMKYCCDSHKESFEGVKTIKNKTFGELTDFLIKKCDDHFKNVEYDVVILENQPAFLNPHMKSVQMILFTYFKINGKKIIMQNASTKFYSKKFEKKKDGKTNNTYRLGKKFSIDCACALLSKNDFLRMKEYGKMDDLCDCINHSVAFLCKNKKIPDVIKNLL